MNFKGGAARRAATMTAAASLLLGTTLLSGCAGDPCDNAAQAREEAAMAQSDFENATTQEDRVADYAVMQKFLREASDLDSECNSK